MKGILDQLGLDPNQCRWAPVSGGDIHQAWNVLSPKGPLFIKTNASPPPDIFATEARGLEALGKACKASSALSVPRVLGHGERYLALEWIDSGASTGDSDKSAALLGEGLAALHEHSSHFFGWEEDNWIGTLPQQNSAVPLEQGPAAFFATQRLQVQARIGRNKLSPRLLSLLERLCERIDEWIGLPGEAPALVHGDLWGGNWMVGRKGRPWIFDPAPHYGCREAELAFTELFGGFPNSFYEAYRSHKALEPGYRERVDLWNLYPLLVHANLFGGGYAARAERTLARFVG